MRRSNSLFYLFLFLLTIGIAGQVSAGRYYDPAIGRWATFDPALNEQSPQELLELQNGKLFSHSPYSYGYANPLRFTDPDGKTPWDIIDIGFALWSVKDFVANPSWSNAGWAVADVVAAVVPLVPSSRYFRIGDKAADVIRNTEKGSKGSQKLLNAPKFHKHHVFPQNTKMKTWFKDKGIDVDDFTVKLDEKSHLSGVHGKGEFVGPGSENFPSDKWNERWGEFMKENPNATLKEIYQHAGKLMDEFGLNHIKIEKYK